MEKIRIAIGCDQAGYEMKLYIMKHLEERGVDFVDLGTDSTDSVNYPDYAHKVCRYVQQGKCDRGILICGTGIGMSMAANKHKGIRAACCADSFSARLTRQHNDANVLCFGARVVGIGVAVDIVDAFLDGVFEGGRHQKRVDLIMDFENTEYDNISDN